MGPTREAVGVVRPRREAPGRAASGAPVSSRERVPAPSASGGVVAIVVTRDPGPEFEDCLASLVSQDPGVPVLVLDDGSAVDVTPRVGAVAPRAYVRRLSDSVGYADAVDDAVRSVDGASAYVLCHDDVALAPDAVRRLVAARQQHDASIVGAKIVDWDDHERIVSLGPTIGRIGAPIVDEPELDQGQHDLTRETGAVHNAAFLITADAYAELGGFSGRLTPPGVGPDAGEDLDLCWRAVLAGHPVVIAGMARVAHRGRVHSLANEGAASGDHDRVIGDDPIDTGAVPRGEVRRRSRAALASTVAHGPRLRAPIVAVGSFVDAVGPGTGARADRVRDWAGAMGLGLPGLVQAHGGRRWAANRSVRGRDRHVPDGEATWGRVRALVRLAGSSTAVRWGLLAAVAYVLAVIVGSRRMLGSGLARVGQFVGMESAGSLVRAARAGGSTSGFAGDGPAAPGYLPTAVLTAFGGSRPDRFAAWAAVFALLAGVVGAMRLAARIVAPASAPTSPLGPVLTRLAAGGTYAAVPLGYDAFAAGQTEVLIAVGALPWLMLVLLREGGWLRVTASKRVARGTLRSALPLIRTAVPAGFVAAVAAPVTVLAGALGVVIAATALVLGRWRAALALGGVALGALSGSCLLLLPWSADAISRALGSGGRPVDTTAVLGSWTGPQPTSVNEVLSFGAGPMASVWSLLLFVGPLVAVVVCTGTRMAWTLRWWVVALVAFAIAIAGGPLGVDHLPPPALVSVAAALALSQLAALSVAGFGFRDEAVRFGWRSVAVGAGVGAAVLGVFAVPVSARDGAWSAPRLDTAGALGWLDQVGEAEPGFRVLWVGSPEVVPGATHRIDSELSMAVTRDGLARVGGAWPGRVTVSEQALADRLLAVRSRGVVRGGEALGRLGVRYIVVVEDLGPGPSVPVDAALVDGLGRQLDLRARRAPAGLRVFEDVAYRSVVRAEAADGSWTPVALTGSAASWSGVVPSGRRLVITDPFSDRWTVAGSDGAVALEPAEGGLALRTVTPVAGRVTLAYEYPRTVALAQIAALATWIALLALAARFRPGVPATAGFGALPTAQGLDDEPRVIDDDPDILGLDDEIAWGQTVQRASRSARLARTAKAAGGIATARRTGAGAGAGVVLEDGADATATDVEADGALASQLWSEWSERRAVRDRDRARDREHEPARSGGRLGRDSKRAHDMSSGAGDDQDGSR